jgi:hypothetical protein
MVPLQSNFWDLFCLPSCVRGIYARVTEVVSLHSMPEAGIEFGIRENKCRILIQKFSILYTSIEGSSYGCALESPIILTPFYTRI